jgi:hypothetical protein
MMLREMKLISLIVALCALATLSISAAYTNLNGTTGRIAPLLIVIALIVIAISLLEVLTQKVEVPSPTPIDARGKESVTERRRSTIEVLMYPLGWFIVWRFKATHHRTLPRAGYG